MEFRKKHYNYTYISHDQSKIIIIIVRPLIYSILQLADVEMFGILHNMPLATPLIMINQNNKSQPLLA